MTNPINGKLPILIATVFITLLSVAAIIIIVILRPKEDNSTLYTIIGAAVAPTTAALLGYMKSEQTHVLVNSQMDAFKKLLLERAEKDEAIAHAEGVKQGLREKQL